MGKQVTSKISPTQVGTGRSKQNLYTATKVSGPIGTPPTYITDIIKYDINIILKPRAHGRIGERPCAWRRGGSPRALSLIHI